MAETRNSLEELGIVDADPYLGIGNEFSGAQIRKVRTRQGERLEVFIPKNDTRILLDAMQLEILAEQDAELFTTLIAAKLDQQGDDHQPGEKTHTT
ncbi:hypothetical protein [Mycobacterium sp.]|uniref:hypothetical protein n=1 Tax=Mycobacterium sp. TaxID=1785 RepID=UPI002C5329EE|nr:hypothetical protein [Mycobacterium sp.]HKP42725.1 hypothetical protein [Mycobacterium sp.]